MRKEQLHIVLDMDGVIADFEGEFCRKFGNNRRDLVNLVSRYPSRKTEIENFVAARETYVNLLIIPVGVEIARWCMAHGRDGSTRVFTEIVTGRPLSSLPITKYWLKENKVPHSNLFVAGSSGTKENYIRTVKPDIIVDDIINVCQNAYNSIPGVKVVLVKQPWNETPFFSRITTLAQFQRIYEEVASEKLLSESLRVDGM